MGSDGEWVLPLRFQLPPGFLLLEALLCFCLPDSLLAFERRGGILCCCLCGSELGLQFACCGALLGEVLFEGAVAIAQAVQLFFETARFGIGVARLAPEIRLALRRLVTVFLKSSDTGCQRGFDALPVL